MSGLVRRAVTAGRVPMSSSPALISRSSSLFASTLRSSSFSAAFQSAGLRRTFSSVTPEELKQALHTTYRLPTDKSPEPIGPYTPIMKDSPRIQGQSLTDLVVNLPKPVDFEPKDPETWVHKNGYGLRFARLKWLKWNKYMPEPMMWITVTKCNPQHTLPTGKVKRTKVFGWKHDKRAGPHVDRAVWRFTYKSKGQVRIKGAMYRDWYCLDEQSLIAKLQEREMSLLLQGKVDSLTFNKLVAPTPLGLKLWAALPAELRSRLEAEAEAEKRANENEDAEEGNTEESEEGSN